MDAIHFKHTKQSNVICEFHRFIHPVEMVSMRMQMINELHEEILKSILFQLPSLRGLHIVGCQKVDHLVVLRLVAYTPLLESLSLTTSVRKPWAMNNNG